MLIDFREFDHPANLQADLCIIGGGAVGIAIAREFIGTQLQILILESGGLEYEPETQELYEGRNTGRPYYDLDTTRLRYFGGSTNHWEGACGVLDELDFEKRPWVSHSGWPITKAELLPYYEQAAPICGVGPFVFSFDLYRDVVAQDLPLDESVLRRRVWQRHPEEPRRFGDAFRAELESASNVRVIVHANVTRLRSNASATRVTSVDIATLSGQRGAATARAYVLCCGGLENPRLLLASNDVVPVGLGNDHDLVGRFFMEHLHAGAARLLPAKPAFIYDNLTRYDGFFSAIAIGPDAQRRREVLNWCAMPWNRPDPGDPIAAVMQAVRALAAGSVPDDPVRTAGLLITNADRILYNAYRWSTGRRLLHQKHIMLDAVGEQAPDPESRVMLSDERDSLGMPRIELRWRITELERRSVAELFSVIGTEFGRLDLGRIRLEDWLANPDAGWPEDLRGDHHHMGTTRMAEEPREGVVDRDCRVHGIDNLFIGGSSVFPTSGYVNPTLTIVALALRLAERLRAVISAT